MENNSTARVEFDDGHTVDVRVRSRDLLALEREGVNFETVGAIEAGFLGAFAALQRMERTGQLPEGVTLPATAAEFMDVADITERQDDAGEASGQEATTG